MWPVRTGHQTVTRTRITLAQKKSLHLLTVWASWFMIRFVTERGDTWCSFPAGRNAGGRPRPLSCPSLRVPSRRAFIARSPGPCNAKSQIQNVYGCTCACTIKCDSSPLQEFESCGPDRWIKTFAEEKLEEPLWHWTSTTIQEMWVYRQLQWSMIDLLL